MRQLQRASLSVVLNLVEGYAWRPGAKWRHHLRIAYGSALESVEVTEFLGEIGVGSPREVEALLGSQRRAAGLVYGLIKSPR
jgi:four helix bundle protein